MKFALCAPTKSARKAATPEQTLEKVAELFGIAAREATAVELETLMEELGISD